MKKWIIIISAVFLLAQLATTVLSNHEVNANIASEKKQISARIEIFRSGADRIRAKRIAQNLAMNK
jgi:hypothetical protein